MVNRSLPTHTAPQLEDWPALDVEVATRNTAGLHYSGLRLSATFIARIGRPIVPLSIR